MAELNLLAGKKAKASAAYQPAYSYLKVGIDLLHEDSWQQQYDLTLVLYTETAEAAYLCGEFVQTEQLVEVVLQHARTLLDKVNVYEVKIEAYKAQNKLLDAVKTGFVVMKLLGVRFPRKPNKSHRLCGLLTTKLVLAGKQIEDLINLPGMTDPYKFAVLRITGRIVSPAHFVFPELLPLFAFKMLQLSVKHGNAPMSAFYYAGYGFILCAWGEINTGYRFGRLSLGLLERLNVKEFKGEALVSVSVNITHWKEHVRETLPLMLEAYQNALEIGEVDVVLNVFAYVWTSYFIGKELTGLEREIASSNEMMGHIKQATIRHYHNISWQAVRNLIGKHASDSPPWCLAGDTYNEEQMRPLHLQTNDRFGLLAVHCHKLQLCYLFQAYPQAVENAVLTETYLDAGAAMVFIPLFHLYDSLTRLAVYPDASKIEQRRIRRKVAANQKKMQKWAQHAPMNYLHKWHLVEAERARVSGKDLKAMDYYDQAIAGAKANEYLNEEALANEVAARFYLSKGKARIAQVYLREARYCYLKWGALAKVQDLDRRYPELLAETLARRAGDHFRSGIHLSLTDTTRTSSGVLDVSTVLKASQAISSEIVLENLLKRLMAIVIENAGAERGLLLFEEDGAWVVKAEKDPRPDRAGPELVEGFPKPVRSDFPMSMINYAARTKSSVVLADAVREGQFSQDEYLLAVQPRSVLCLPLLNQGQLTGILYLENNLTPGAFTPERLDVLQILAAQAAIAITNATLYTTVEQKVAERTAELAQAKDVALAARQAADAANQAKNVFLSRMSHELRTALNAILGYAQFLKRDSVVMQHQPDAVAAIHRSGEQLLLLITDLLDLSKIEAGKIELHPDYFPFCKFLKNLLDNVRDQARQKNIMLAADFPAELPEIVYGDEHRLRQILTNLLTNAIKFTEKGEVKLRITNEELRKEPTPHPHKP